MNDHRRSVRGISVRTRLLLLSAGPVLVTSALLIPLFLWGQQASSRAYEHALAWEHQAEALRNLNWAARMYFDTVGDRITHDPVSHFEEAKEDLAEARAEALRMAKRFSVEEQRSQEALDAHLAALVEQGDHLDNDRGRLTALKARYDSEIEAHIRRRVAEGEDGSARALRAAQKLSDLFAAGGFAVALLALVCAVVACVLAIRGFGRRVASLDAAAARVAAGDLEAEAPVTSADELGHLARSLNVMIAALRSQRTKQLGFLAAVAHDLKNPLGAMRLSIGTLHQPGVTLSEPLMRKALGIVERQIERLVRLADDLLDAASIEAGELKIHPRACDLTAVLRDVTELYAGASSRHELRVSAPGLPVMIEADGARIAQVLENLVTNAIKYSPAGGTVDVTLTDTADEAVLSVSDKGLGIEPGMFGAIFEPFRRVSPSKDVIPGVGLGLSTCRRIVMAHGGRIEVASKIGQGTTFEVHLPRQRTQLSATRPRSVGGERAAL